MIIRIAETDELTEITLHYWDGRGWSENLFDDLAYGFASGCESKFDYDSVIYTASKKELNRLIEYWQNEVELVNSGDYSEKLSLKDGADLPAGCHYLLIVGTWDAGEYYDYG